MSYRQSEPTQANRMWPFVVTNDASGDPDATVVDHTNLQRQKLGGAFANLTNDPIQLTGITGAWWVELAVPDLDTPGPLGLRAEKAGIRTVVTWEDVDIVPPRPDYFVGEPDASRRVFPFVMTDVPNGDPLETPIDKTNVQIFKFGALEAVNVATDPAVVAGQDGARELTFTQAEIDTPGPMCVCISKPGTIRTIIAFVFVGQRSIAVAPVVTPPPTPATPTVVNPIVRDHVAEALARLPQQFRGTVDKPTVEERLLKCLVKPFQTFADIAEQVRTLRTIEDAEGVTLSMIGGLVGQPPVDVDEDTFRIFVRSRIRANRSSGMGDEVLRIARLVLSAYLATPPVAAAGTLRIVASRRSRASYVLSIENADVPWSLAAILAQSFLEEVTGTGIRGVLEFVPQEDAVYDAHDHAFSFDDDGDGWGDTLDATSGGLMAAVIE